MQLRSMLLLLGVSFFIFAGFKSSDQRSAKAIQSNDQPTPVWIELVYTGVLSPGTLTGTFTAHGALETSGTVEMTVHRYANVAHCSQTLEDENGTITVLTNCQFSTMDGTWRVVSGTGAYWDLEGNGKLHMTSPGGVVLAEESWSGKVR